MTRNATQTPRLTWTRTQMKDGYITNGARIFDNGAGLGPSKGSGRWAVEVAGQWVLNADTLKQAKLEAEDRLGFARSDDPELDALYNARRDAATEADWGGTSFKRTGGWASLEAITAELHRRDPDGDWYYEGDRHDGRGWQVQRPDVQPPSTRDPHLEQPTHRFPVGTYIVHKHSSPEALGSPVVEHTWDAQGRPTYTVRDAQTGLDDHDVPDSPDYGEPGTVNAPRFVIRQASRPATPDRPHGPQSRPGRWLVVDTETGAVVSSHPDDSDAWGAAAELNAEAH